MMFRRFALTVLMLAVTLRCLSDEPQESSIQVSLADSERNQAAVLTNLRSALDAARKPGRLYYHGLCQHNNPYFIPFPLTRVHPPPKDKACLDAVRGVFYEDSDVAVTQDKSGIVRITIGDVPTAILQTKVSLIDLGPTERYNPVPAIIAIMQTTELQVAMKKLGLSAPVKVTDLLVVFPTKGLPHLPPTLRNVTVEEALDTIAKTFNGIVLYGVCTCPDGKGQLDIDFASLAGDDSGTPGAVGK